MSRQPRYRCWAGESLVAAGPPRCPRKCVRPLRLPAVALRWAPPETPRAQPRFVSAASPLETPREALRAPHTERPPTRRGPTSLLRARRHVSNGYKRWYRDSNGSTPQLRIDLFKSLGSFLEFPPWTSLHVPANLARPLWRRLPTPSACRSRSITVWLSEPPRRRRAASSAALTSGGTFRTVRCDAFIFFIVVQSKAPSQPCAILDSKFPEPAPCPAPKLLFMYNFAFLLQSQTATNPALSFLPLIVIVAIFYFLVFMPMQRQKKQQAQMLANLESGAEVLTTGGIVGTIVSISGDTLILRVKPDNIKLQIARSAISGLIKQEAVTEKK